jgi:hypothetical protein
MKRLLIGLLAAAVWAAPAGSGDPNMLTPQESAQGWKLLFDGKTLDGWQQMGGTQWKVENGVLVPSGKYGWLATTGDYTNFMLKADFRTSAANLNSGIFLRRGRDEKDSHQIGYELQIRDEQPGDKPYDGKPTNHSGYYTGSFSGHLKSHNEPKIVLNQWHTFEVTAQGDHFIVLYDGTKVLDANQSEFTKGAIGLQYTGQNVEFRSIKVKPL